MKPRGNYYTVSNKTPLAEEINSENVFLHEGEKLDTWKLINQPKIKEFINQFDSPKLVVFKNTKQIQRKCNQENWGLLNPNAKLINKVEQKISQVKWMGDLTKLMPNFEVKTCKEVNYNSTPFILQFNRAHTGSGTYLINSSEKLESLQNNFPDRPAKIIEYINGDMYTLNCVVNKNKILTSSLSYQITGVKPFTQNDFATVGNDWGLAEKTLTESDKKKIEKMGKEIGKKLRKDNFSGLFGIDVIKSDSDEIHLIEINARQPASTTFESKLQQKKNVKITTFRTHLSSLLEQELNEKIKEINSGAQIIYRNENESKIKVSQAKTNLEQAGFDVIFYENKEENSELLRIMHDQSFFDRPNKFNSSGKQIVTILSEAKVN